MNELSYVLVVVGLTAFLQAITGFGFSLLAVPLLAIRTPVHEAVVLSACLGTMSSCWQSIHLRRFADAAMARRYIVASFVGMPLGFALFITLSDRLMRLVVGVAVLSGTSIVAYLRDVRVGVHVQRLLGVVSGALLLATSTNGPPIVLAMQAQGMVKQQFRGTLARIFFVSGVVSIVLFAGARRLDADIGFIALVSAPVLLVAVLMGNSVARRVQESLFRNLVLLLLVVAGVSSLYGAIR